MLNCLITSILILEMRTVLTSEQEYSHPILILVPILIILYNNNELQVLEFMSAEPQTFMKRCFVGSEAVVFFEGLFDFETVLDAIGAGRVESIDFIDSMKAQWIIVIFL